MSRGKSFVPVRAPEAQVARKARDQPRKPCPECQEKLRVSQPGDALEHEADRTADAVVGRGAPPALTPAPGRIQRQPKDAATAAKLAADDKKMADAAAKAAEAAAATGPGKKLIEKAGDAAKKLVSTPAGAVGTALIAGGAFVGATALRNKLPFQLPAIPIGDTGLKAGLLYEGPLQHPDYVGVTLGGTLPGEPHPRKKKADSGEGYRAETARLRAAQLGGLNPQERVWRPPPGAIRPLIPLVKSAAPPMGSSAVEQKKDLPAPVQRKARTAGPVSGEPVCDALSEGGEALDPATREFMEQRFGRDFSAVRVHAGWRGARAADALEARAFTLGAQIAFGAGEYRPASESGRHLLAHELAHVVQQGAAAPVAAVTGAAAPAAALPALARAPMAAFLDATIARATKPSGGKSASCGPGCVPIELEKTGARPSLAFEITPEENPYKDSKGDTLHNFSVNTLWLPGTKGPNAKNAYQDLSKGKALASTVQLDEVQSNKASDENAQAALWQKRSESLRKRWRDARGWGVGEDADANWQDAGGGPKFPRVGNEICQMDHIVELQLGGSNTNENIQALNPQQNQSAGGFLKAELFGLAAKIRGNKELHASSARQIRMQFRSAKLSTPLQEPSCLKVESSARKIKPAGKRYPITTQGNRKTDLIVKREFLRNKKAEPLVLDGVNRAAKELIPGFLLLTLRHTGKENGMGMDASIDTRAKTRLPLIFEDARKMKGGLEFDVTNAPKNELKLTEVSRRKVKLPFWYEGLSPGEITKITPTADGVDFAGTIRPTVPFLGKLDIAYERGKLGVTKGLEPEQLRRRPPFHGAKVTEASVDLELAPQLKAQGKLGFEYVPHGKKMLDAKVAISADVEGLRAQGNINAYLPGVDDVTGHLEYSRAKGWSGGAKASATKLKQKFKYARDGEVEIGLKQDAKGATQIDARGKFTLDLPHTQGVTTELETKGGRWLFRGKGRFDVPRLKPIDITIEYDGKHLSGEAKNVGFRYNDFKATLDLKYHDEKFSGAGKLAFAKGRAKGDLRLELLPSGRFTGEGSVTLRIKEGIEATGGIAIDKEEKVSVKGKLDFVKPIALFHGFGDEITLLETGISIPIPGASIAGVGLNVRIEGALKAGYRIGPGEIRNAAVETAFNPLEEKPDFKVDIRGQLWIGASAHVSGTISGLIVLDLALAKASGGLSVSAMAKLNGEVLSAVTLHYEKSNFDVEAKFAASLALAIRLALEARVRASAGIGPFTADTEKHWELAAKEFDTGLKLGLKVAKPLTYSSEKGLATPSPSDVEITKPQLDAKKLLRDVFGSADGKEQHQ